MYVYIYIIKIYIALKIYITLYINILHIFILYYIILYIAIYTSTRGIPISLYSSSSSTQHHHLTLASGMSPGWDCPSVPCPAARQGPSPRRDPIIPKSLLGSIIFPVLEGGGSDAQTKPAVAVSTGRGAAPSPKILPNPNPKVLISSGTRLGQGMPTPGSATGAATFLSAAP